MTDTSTLSLSKPDRDEVGGGNEPSLILALECFDPLAAPERFSLAELDEVELGRGSERDHRWGEQGPRRLRIDIADNWMSSSHARLVREGSSWNLCDAGSKNGTLLNGVLIEKRRLRSGDLIEAGHTFFLFRTASSNDIGDGVARDSAEDPAEAALATANAMLEAQFHRLERVAGATTTVLIRGESGTGKEVCARAVHHLSGRNGRFVAINCGALPASLLEAELFGFRKGAFSGATSDRVGLVRAADGGTLFLDEVAELPEPSQVAFLRVLQEKEVVPVGDTKPVAVDLRVIAATHQDLSARVADGRFRRDLFGRLAAFEFELPPLRARREDIGLLSGRLLRRIAGDRAGELSFQAAAARALFAYGWPLNIRGLENALRSAISLVDGHQIRLEHLPQEVREALESFDVSRRRRVAELERREELVRLLREHGGNVSAVARALATSRGQVRRLCSRFEIEIDSFRQ